MNKMTRKRHMLQIEIDPKLHAEAKKAAIDMGIELKEWVAKTMKYWLDEEVEE